MNHTDNRVNRRGVLKGAAALMAGSALMTHAAWAITTAEIKSKGKIVIGIQSDNRPWGYMDAATGQADGIDADMGKLFGKELGVPVEFVGLEVANRIPALTAGRVDVLFATMAMFPERAKAVQFSKPYVANSIYLIAPKTTVVKSDADMGKLVIAVARASAQEAEVTKHAPSTATIRRFDSDAASIQAMLSGQVQAIGGNVFYAKRLNEATPDVYENKLEFTQIFNGLCSRLEDKELNGALNAFVDKVRANGELAKIQQKWMGGTMLKFPETMEGVPFVAK